jgi:succinoglycan biosynthesis protein ExoA
MSTIADRETNLEVAPRISVVIPARNEEHHLLGSLAAVWQALRRVGGGEVLVVDGMSSDRTRHIAEEFARDHAGVRVIENPARTTPAAFNIGIRAARGTLISIVSAHCIVGIDFFKAGVQRIDEGRADIVGGPILAESGSPGILSWLLSQIVSHPFGVGNSKFRISSSPGYVDAVPFAIYKAEVFHHLGLFNLALKRNQDTEFFGRVDRARLQVFLDPGMTAVYLARGTLWGLLRQGFLNAYWNVLVWSITPAAFRWRHLIPCLFAVGLLLTAIVGFWAPLFHTALAAGLALYWAVATVASIQIVARSRRVAGMLLPPLFLLYHFFYGCGTLAGIRHLFARGGYARGTSSDPPPEELSTGRSE